MEILYSRRDRAFVPPTAVTAPHEIAESSAGLDSRCGRITTERRVDPVIIDVTPERIELSL